MDAGYYWAKSKQTGIVEIVLVTETLPLEGQIVYEIGSECDSKPDSWEFLKRVEGYVE